MSEQQDKKGLGIKPSQVAAGALASVTAAVLGSFLGVAGTVIGAGLASIISTVGAALYQHSLDRTKQAVVRNTGALRVSPQSRAAGGVRQQLPTSNSGPATGTPPHRAPSNRPPVNRGPFNNAPPHNAPSYNAHTTRATAVGHYAPVQLDADAAAIANLAVPTSERRPRPGAGPNVGRGPTAGRNPAAGRDPMSERTHVIQGRQAPQRTQFIQRSEPSTWADQPVDEGQPRRKWQPNWARVVGISALVFVLGMLSLTGIEWIKGSSFGGGGGGGSTTVGRVFHEAPATTTPEKPAQETRKPNPTNENSTKQQQPAATPTQQPETGAATPAPATTAVPTPTQQQTPNPQPGVVPPSAIPTH